MLMLTFPTFDRVLAAGVQAFAGLAGAASSAAAALTGAVLRWRERAEQRRRLSEMNDHLLRDIGLDRGQAFRETIKPFWRG